jgi:hypothetical protein
LWWDLEGRREIGVRGWWKTHEGLNGEKRIYPVAQKG